MLAAIVGLAAIVMPEVQLPAAASRAAILSLSLSHVCALMCVSCSHDLELHHVCALMPSM